MKILIVDDERRIREGIRKIIDYEALGCEIIGEAANGQAAIELIQNLKPDLCIMDIKMPVLNGIEVIEKMTAKGCLTKFILLTGFGEFDYAKRAMNCGVVDYLLKPIDEVLLEEKIISYQKKHSQLMTQLERDEISSLWYMNSLMLKWLFQEDIKIHDLNEHLEMPLPWQNYQLVLIKPEKVLDMSNGSFRQLIMGSTHQVHMLIEQRHQWVLILKDQPLVNQHQVLCNIKEDLAKSYQSLWVVVCGPCVKEASQLKTAYDETNEMMAFSYLFNKDEVLHYDQLSTLGEDLLATKLMDWVYKMSQVMTSGTLEDYNVVIDHLFRAIREEKGPLQLTMTKYTQFYTLLIKLFQQEGHLEEDFHLSELELEKLSLQSDHYHVQTIMAEKLLALRENVQTKEQVTIATMVKNYIDIHYGRELKLEEIAQFMNYNSAYIGKQFKKETGQYYNTYLDQYRLNKGKELLLSSSMKVYEIAKKVGYSDPDYFASKFKKYVGTSPKSYRSSS